MKRALATLSTLCATLILMACGGMEPADEYREAVPTRSQLEMTVPGSSQSATTGEGIGALSQALLGQRSDLYTLTYNVSHDVNGSIWVGLHTIESIIQHPPTNVGNNAASWGPWVGPLEPLAWMLVVSKQGPDTYNYVLSARHKSDANGAFSPIIAGQSVKGASPYFSGYKGVYTANASNLNALDPITYPDTGKMVATYDTTGDRRKVEMALKDYSEDGGDPASVLYSYLDRIDASGEFRFVAHADIQEDGSAPEVAVVGTAWDETGAGRGDAAVTGGDLPAGFTLRITECWDSSFGRVFYMDSADSNPTEGDPAACVFSAPVGQ